MRRCQKIAGAASCLSTRVRFPDVRPQLPRTIRPRHILFFRTLELAMGVRDFADNANAVCYVASVMPREHHLLQASY